MSQPGSNPPPPTSGKPAPPSNPPLTRAQHRRRHIELHRALDELVADFVRHNKDKHLTTTTLMEFIEWSGRQVSEPTTGD